MSAITHTASIETSKGKRFELSHDEGTGTISMKLPALWTNRVEFASLELRAVIEDLLDTELPILDAHPDATPYRAKYEALLASMGALLGELREQAEQPPSGSDDAYVAGRIEGAREGYRDSMRLLGERIDEVQSA